jgi:hypothetical protein
MPVLLMAELFAACSILPFPIRDSHTISAQTTLFRYHQWQANLRFLSVDEIKSIPYTPTSHPFIERLVGTIRREHMIDCFSGMRATCGPSSHHSLSTTINIAFTNRWMDEHLPV